MFRWWVTAFRVVVFFHLSRSVTGANYVHKTSRWYYTSIRITMSEAPPLNYPRDSSSKRGAKERLLDPEDPNDNAFELVSVEILFLVDFLWIFFSFTALIITLDHSRCRNKIVSTTARIKIVVLFSLEIRSVVVHHRQSTPSPHAARILSPPTHAVTRSLIT